VEAGWNLHELHAVGSRLEEIFLRLTASVEHSDEVVKDAPEKEPDAATESAGGAAVGAEDAGGVK
jgi:hypothetical protein